MLSKLLKRLRINIWKCIKNTWPVVKVINLIDWLIEKVINSKQKYVVTKLLTTRQKRFVQNLLSSGRSYAQHQVERCKLLLFEYGFTERAHSDLKELAESDSNTHLTGLAAWELALNYANQNSIHGYEQCLSLLPRAIQDGNSPTRLQQATVIESECYVALGNYDVAKSVISHVLTTIPNADIFLAAANLEHDLQNKSKWINKCLSLFDISAVSFNDSLNLPIYQRLITNRVISNQKGITDELPKVTVIVPVYNYSGVIQTTLESLLSQTWAKMEILVVDDGSNDATLAMIKEYMGKDSRIQLIKTEPNMGSYVSRNLALQKASGEFVTCQNADSWSHPQRIEKQVMHLLSNLTFMGNISQQVITTDELKFCRLVSPGSYIFNAISSFMFRRKPVMEAIGYWDCVMFGADSEYISRVRKAFGDKAVAELTTGPLIFQRQSSSLMDETNFIEGLGYLMGAKKEYFEGYKHFYATTDTLYYEFPQVSRPFAVPRIMLPTRELDRSKRRHFDVIIASDFRLSGGSNMSNIEEIKAQRKMGLCTGLIQMSRYDFDPKRSIIPKVRELIDGDRVQMLVYGEKVSCDLLILRYPPILQEWQRYVPDVEAKEVHIIVNQPPMSDYGSDGVVRYNIKRCHNHIQKYFGKAGIWYPIGPLVREALYEHHADDLPVIKLSNEDWVNIIDVDEWRRTKLRPIKGQKIKIGRHSRDHFVKWPVNKDELLAIYPDSNDYEVHILGGAKAPRKVLGRLPKNWHVLEFGEVHPKEFLSQLDVFVYYTHPDWVESFGRVIIEAMAVGVPVIVPHIYRDLFREAAIYAEPSEVKENIARLMNDYDYYQAQVEKAYSYVDKHFGYTKHAARLQEYVQKMVAGNSYPNND